MVTLPVHTFEMLLVVKCESETQNYHYAIFCLRNTSGEADLPELRRNDALEGVNSQTIQTLSSLQGTPFVTESCWTGRSVSAVDRNYGHGWFLSVRLQQTRVGLHGTFSILLFLS